MIKKRTALLIFPFFNISIFSFFWGRRTNRKSQNYNIKALTDFLCKVFLMNYRIYRIYRNNQSNRKIQKIQNTQNLRSNQNTQNILKTQKNLSLSLGEGWGEVLKIT